MKKIIAVLLILSVALLMSGCTDGQVRTALVDMGYAPAEPAQTVSPSPAQSPSPTPTPLATATPAPTLQPTPTPRPDNVDSVEDIIDLEGYPKSIKLSKKKLALTPGQSRRLKVTLKPKKAKIKDVTWSSSDENIAVVSDKGKITAVNVGQAVITCQTANGLKAECRVTVGEKKAKALYLSDS